MDFDFENSFYEKKSSILKKPVFRSSGLTIKSFEKGSILILKIVFTEKSSILRKLPFSVLGIDNVDVADGMTDVPHVGF